MAKKLSVAWLIAAIAFFLFKVVERNGLYETLVVLGISGAAVATMVAFLVLFNDE